MRYFVWLLCFPAAVSYADAYRCMENGKVVISNYPCAATKVVRAHDVPQNSAWEANQETARQRSYLAQREVQKRNDDQAVLRQQRAVEIMYPATPEPVKPSSSGISFGSCGLGGSCSTTRIISR